MYDITPPCVPPLFSPQQSVDLAAFRLLLGFSNLTQSPHSPNRLNPPNFGLSSAVSSHSVGSLQPELSLDVSRHNAMATVYLYPAIYIY